MEYWVDIKDFEGFYQISNKGNVRSLDRGIKCRAGGSRIIKGITLTRKTNKCGYYTHTLQKLGRGKYLSLHRLIAIAFIPNPENYKCINHLDGDKMNNLIDNLEWCSHSQNTKHAYDTGLIRRSKQAKPKCFKYFMKALYGQGYTKLKISKILDVAPSTVIRQLEKVL